jgi:flavodoxin
MKIGIIVYSRTGNTLSVALKLKEKLSKAGHAAEIERVTTDGEIRPGAKNLPLKTLPEVSTYQALVFAAPVLAFSLSPVMKSYLPQITSLKGKKVALLVTQYFPFKWMGGNQAVGIMTKICRLKGADVSASGIINWSKKNRNQQITEVVDLISGLFL